MSEEQKNKYAFELMIKNNPDEAVKQLIMLNKFNQQNLEKRHLLQQRIDKVIKYIEEHKRNVYDTFGEGIVFGEIEGIQEILDILRGEDNEK